VTFVLAATLTLLPAVLARLGGRIERGAMPWRRKRAVADEGSPRFARWAERLWRQPKRWGALALVVLVALTVPALSLTTGMPSIKVVPQDDGSAQGYALVQKGFGPGAPG